MAAKRAKKSKKKAKAKRSVAAKVRRGAKAVKRIKARKALARKASERKAPARKVKAPVRTAKAKKARGGRKDVHGEGNYTAAREFDKEQTEFVKKNRARIPALAKDAEKALEGPQGDELRQAEEEAKSHAHTQEAAE